MTPMRRSLHILLAFSLLFLSWYQIAHELKAHAGQSSTTCEICLFTGYLGHGAPSIPFAPPQAPVHSSFVQLLPYTEPCISPDFLFAFNVRGPPRLSLA